MFYFLTNQFQMTFFLNFLILRSKIVKRNPKKDVSKNTVHDINNFEKLAIITESTNLLDSMRRDILENESIACKRVSFSFVPSLNATTIMCRALLSPTVGWILSSEQLWNLEDNMFFL